MGENVNRRLWLLVVLGVCGSTAQDPAVQYGYKRYIEYYPGSVDSPLLITVPQGGTNVSHRIPTRYRGCWNAETKECTYTHLCPENTGRLEKRCLVYGGTADYTVDLGKLSRWWIGQVTGLYPHLVLSTVHRKYLDPDNPRDIATFGNVEAAMAYDDYHNFISKAEKNAHLLVNLHGHNRYADQLQLVYISSPTDPVTNVPPNATSIDHLYNTSENVASREDMLLGSTSLGAYFEAAGYDTIPSPQHPDIHTHRYVRGDYTLETYSDHTRSTDVAAVELSIPRLLRGGVAGPEFAEDMARVLLEFLATHLPTCGQACDVRDDIDVAITDYFKYNAASKLEGGMMWFWTLTVTALIMF